MHSLLMKKASIFGIPLSIGICWLVGYGGSFWGGGWNMGWWGLGLAIGVLYMGINTWRELRDKHVSLDYLAFLALALALLTKEWQVGLLLLIMFSGGRALEEWAAQKAKRSLAQLTSRIPHTATLWTNNGVGEEKALATIEVGTLIHVSTGEVVPLDGKLQRQAVLVDQSSLTGEVMPVKKKVGDVIRSGTVILSTPAVIETTKKQAESAYQKIIALVSNAQGEKPPMERMADRYALQFTGISLSLALLAGVLTRSWEGVLAVLVLATPCPLLLATPIGLLGGMGAFARNHIILKRLAALEALAEVQVLLLDKTGTLTLGKPKLTQVTVVGSLSEKKVMGIVCGIEKNSVHPLAKALVNYAKENKINPLVATEVTELAGKGISGKVGNQLYRLKSFDDDQAGVGVELQKGHKTIAVFHLADSLKRSSKKVIQRLMDKKVSVEMYTGDTKENALEVQKQLALPITIKAECSPEEKLAGIKQKQKEGMVVGMVGDGINDAPALAQADVGMVFSHEEQTASSEAADVVLLKNEFESVERALFLAKQTKQIVKQSILGGMGLSVLGMVLAAWGWIPPLYGVILQELIDVLSILNSLRTTKL